MVWERLVYSIRIPRPIFLDRAFFTPLAGLVFPKSIDGEGDFFIMKWFKHFSDAHDDEVMEEYLSKFGLAAYGMWWLILEKISSQMHSNSGHSVTLSRKNWRRFFRISTKKLNYNLAFLEKHGKVTLENDGEMLTISCEKLLKFRDEYSGRRNKNINSDIGTESGQNRDNVHQEGELDREGDKKDNTPYTPQRGVVSYSEPFLSFWAIYPKRIGKGAAWKAWGKIPGINGNLEKILLAINSQIKSSEWINEDGKFIPHPATWLNQRRWEDEINEVSHGRRIKSTYERLTET